MKRIYWPLFLLEKHYFDFFDKSGNCIIIYSASLRTGPFILGYSSLLTSGANESVAEESSWRAAVVNVKDGVISIVSKPLSISGNWVSLAQYRPRFIYEGGIGCNLLWDCHHPISTVSLQHNGELTEGIGYAETIRLSIVPWKLPVRELYWGRFATTACSVVWILWKGSYPVSKVWYNGREYNDLVVSSDEILFENSQYKLVFENPVTIRKGKIGKLFSGMPWLKIFFRKGILNYVEAKFRSRARLLSDNSLINEGWAVYEKVSWEK